jgi:signal transduction histidine kinase
MLVVQLISGTVIFLVQFLSRSLQPEPLIALFLAFLILVSGGFVFPSAGIRLALAILKIALCLLLKPFAPLPLFLLPAIGLELPAFFPGRKFTPPLWTGYACALSLLVFLLPNDLALYFLGFWALAVYVALSEKRQKASTEGLAARIHALEKELDDAEAKRAFLEKTNAEQELLIKLEERDRIAQNLHDELGHTMTGSIMQLEAAGLLFQDEPGRAEEIVGKVTRSLREGLAAIRLSLKAIKPEPALLGLQRIQAMLNAFEASHGMTAGLATEGDIRTLSPRLWQVIESNLQEALTNMLRHSSGRRFSCRISVLNKIYKVEFRDDGLVGRAVRKGMGLEGMETRTRAAGGTLIIDTNRGFSAIMLFAKGGPKDGDTDSDR